MKKTILITVLALFSFSVFAQEELENQIQKTGFVIIYASQKYEAAKKTAEEAALKLGYELNFRGLEQHQHAGLTFTKKECETHGFEYPAFVPRGRGGGEQFVSVEYTNHYDGFATGYYIVVVADSYKGSPLLDEALAHTKKSYPTAYIKYADIYVGCIH